MRIVAYATCLALLIVLWLAPSAVAAGAAGYYLASRPTPWNQGVPMFNHRKFKRKYATYLWKLTQTKAKFQLEKVASVPTGGGGVVIELWPSASLLAVDGYPYGYGPNYGFAHDWPESKWGHHMLVKLFDLNSPEQSPALWLPDGGFQLIRSAPGNYKLVIQATGNTVSLLNLAAGVMRRINPRRVSWEQCEMNGGPSANATPILWARIRRSGNILIAPSSPPHLSLDHLKYFTKTPWHIPQLLLKQAIASDPKYTWMLINTPRVLVIGRPNKAKIINTIYLYILNKIKMIWSYRRIDSGDWFRRWAFGPWVAFRIYSPDYNDAVGTATGSYWFYNSATGQSWQQKLGDQHTWLLYMNSHYALVRRRNNLYRFTVGKNKLWQRKLLISDPRIRCVYWACPVPKPRASGKQNHPQFFWEKPGFKLPKALQPPLGVAGSPTTAPAR